MSHMRRRLRKESAGGPANLITAGTDPQVCESEEEHFTTPGDLFGDKNTNWTIMPSNSPGNLAADTCGRDDV
jgi:hypothetical protein